MSVESFVIQYRPDHAWYMTIHLFFLNHISLLIVHPVIGTQTKYIAHYIGGRVEFVVFFPYSDTQKK